MNAGAERTFQVKGREGVAWRDSGGVESDSTPSEGLTACRRAVGRGLRLDRDQLAASCSGAQPSSPPGAPVRRGAWRRVSPEPLGGGCGAASRGRTHHEKPRGSTRRARPWVSV